MNIVIGVIIGFLILMLLVIAHEFGHFIVARKNGVEVEEFGIGFPPRAKAWIKDPKTGKWKKLPKSEWGKKQKSLIFSINWLPIGGFCSMKGESDSDTRPHSFGAASFWSKTKILFAGVAMNWLVAFIILTILSWTGMPEFMDNQFTMPGDTSMTPATITVKKVMEDSPAEKAGFKEGDVIKSASFADKATEFYNSSDVINYNDGYAGEEISYIIYRPSENRELDLIAKLNSIDEPYLLGISLSQEGQARYHSTWSAPIVAAVNTVQLTGETYRGLWNMISSFFSGVAKQISTDNHTRAEGAAEIQAAGDSISGPVGIIGVLFPNSVAAGPTTLAFLAAIISVSLACMNVLPIPALDGGRFTLIALFRIRRKKLTKEIEEKIVSRAFIFLLILIALVTILDITRFF